MDHIDKFHDLGRPTLAFWRSFFQGTVYNLKLFLCLLNVTQPGQGIEYANLIQGLISHTAVVCIYCACVAGSHSKYCPPQLLCVLKYKLSILIMAGTEASLHHPRGGKKISKIIVVCVLRWLIGTYGGWALPHSKPKPKSLWFFLWIFTLSLKNLRGNFDDYTYFFADDEDTSDQAKPGPSSEQVIMNLIGSACF